MSDAPVKTCPKCQEEKVERLISLTSFHLKGGGWYSDLYSSSKGGKGATDGGAAKSETKEAKAESKTEAKAESKPASESKTPASK